MLNQEYIKQYKEQTGRDLKKDTEAAYSDFHHLVKKVEKYGITNLQTQLNLWHRGATVTKIEELEKTETEWGILEYLGKQLHSTIVKEMPLVEAGIISYNEED